MRYTDFRDAILAALRKHRRGLTWPELKDRTWVWTTSFMSVEPGAAIGRVFSGAGAG